MGTNGEVVVVATAVGAALLVECSACGPVGVVVNATCTDVVAAHASRHAPSSVDAR